MCATLVRGSRFSSSSSSSSSVCHLDYGGCVAAWRKFRKFRKCPICCGRNIRAVRAAISSAVELVFLITFHCPNGTLVYSAIALLFIRRGQIQRPSSDFLRLAPRASRCCWRVVLHVVDHDQPLALVPRHDRGLELSRRLLWKMEIPLTPFWSISCNTRDRWGEEMDVD